jgi:hypothetical protein
MYLNKPFTTGTQLRKMASRLSIPLTAIIHKNQLNNIKPKTGQKFIINMEDSGGIQGGTHWVALSIEKDDVPIYWDSFAMVPPCEVIDFCKRHNKKKNPIYGDKQIQNIKSGYCGQYCILFLNTITKCKGSSIDKLKKVLCIFK